LGLFDLFKKKHQTEIGKDGENYARNRLAMNHDKVERDPVGSDFKTTDHNPITGKRRVERYEVKVNNSRLSEKQKQTKGLKVMRLKETPFGYEERIENRNGDKLEYDYFRGRYVRSKKQESDLFGFGSSEPIRRSRKRNDDQFDIFGSSNSSSSDFFNLGGGSSKRKKKDDFSFF
jgi:hypothetical protein